MAEWSYDEFTPKEDINGGNKYTINDDLSLEAINAIVSNSLYAASKAQTVFGIVVLDPQIETLTDEQYTNAVINNYLLQYDSALYVKTSEDNNYFYFYNNKESKATISNSYSTILKEVIKINKTANPHTYSKINEPFIDLYNKTQTDTLLTNKQDIMQYSTMPTASQDYVGKIVQYVGTTDSTYTNGYFYKCVENNGTYSWIQTNVQQAGGVETNEVIESAQSLPTASEQTADFVNIIGGNEDGKLYRKKASADWDETTIAGMTWRFNFEYILSSTSPVGQYGTITFNITFETNNGVEDVTYNSMTVNGPMPQSGQLIYGGDMIIDQVGGWKASENCRTIKITGGYDVTNNILINWLKNLESQGYATIVKYASENYSYTGVQDQITSTNKLSADLLQDGTINKVFTETEQSKLAGIENGAEVNDITDVQVNGNSVVTNRVANVIVPTIVANPTLTGTESDLTGLQVGNIKYKVPSGGSSSGVTSLGGATGDIALGSGLTMSGNVLSATGGGAGISQSEVINRPNALPVASASSPDFVQVDGVTYQKKVSSGVPSVITDLTGTTWEFNDVLVLSNIFNYSLNFNYEYDNLIINAYNLQCYGFDGSYFLSYSGQDVYDGANWYNQNYRIISITGGDNATNIDLISWLQNNATMQPVTTYEYIKVVSDNEIIQNKQPLTTPTATSPDFIQINGQVYYKKVTENITSLAGSTWKFNDDLGDLPTEQFNINFSSNGTNYDGIRITTSTMLYGVTTFDTVYLQDAWQNNSYKTISIVDGTDVTDSDFIAWLKANAVRISGGTFTTTYEYALLTSARVIVETYKNGNSGYIIYNDGWCEQWGLLTSGTSVTFIKEFLDTSYNLLVTNNSPTSYNNGIPLKQDGYTTKTTTGFNAYADANLYKNWRAIGYLKAGEYNYQIGASNSGSHYLIESWESSDHKSFYRVYSDGFKECGGYSTTNADSTKEIALPIEFSNAEYVVTFSTISTAGDAYLNGLAVYARTTTKLTVLNRDYGHPILYHCCGY